MAKYAQGTSEGPRRQNWSLTRVGGGWLAGGCGRTDGKSSFQNSGGQPPPPCLSVSTFLKIFCLAILGLLILILSKCVSFDFSKVPD